MKLRQYRKGDRTGCHRVYYRAVHEGTVDHYDAAQRMAWAPDPAPDPIGSDELQKQWCWVAEHLDDIRGFMSLTRDGHISMAFVLPEDMGTGLAGQLYDRILEQARAQRFEKMTVDASHLARRFFEKRGWTVEHREEVTRNGTLLDRFRMSLPLVVVVR